MLSCKLVDYLGVIFNGSARTSTENKLIAKINKNKTVFNIKNKIKTIMFLKRKLTKVAGKETVWVLPIKKKRKRQLFNLFPRGTVTLFSQLDQLIKRGHHHSWAFETYLFHVSITRVWRLPFALYVKVKLSNNKPLPSGHVSSLKRISREAENIKRPNKYFQRN